MNKELEQRFEEHTPMVIYPNGIEESNPSGRVIAEGFAYSEGLFFMDMGWNEPMAGTGSDHWIDGPIKGPFTDPLPDIEPMVGYTQYWKVGEDAFIFELKDEPMQFVSGVNQYLMAVAKYNQTEVERRKNDRFGNRARAKYWADDYVDGLRGKKEGSA
jgi:hypothetical protein